MTINSSLNQGERIFHTFVDNFNAMGQVRHRQTKTLVKSLGAGVVVGGTILLITLLASSGNRLGLGIGLGLTGGLLVSTFTMGYLTYNYKATDLVSDHLKDRQEDAAGIFNSCISWVKKKV